MSLGSASTLDRCRLGEWEGPLIVQPQPSTTEPVARSGRLLRRGLVVESLEGCAFASRKAALQGVIAETSCACPIAPQKLANFGEDFLACAINVRFSGDLHTVGRECPY